jgi:hypothetical protein
LHESKQHFGARYILSNGRAISQGKVHKYLGMMFDYTTPSQVKITMLAAFDAAADTKQGTGAGVKSSVAPPDNLFKVDPDGEKLDALRTWIFHHLVAKTLYTTKHAPPDTSSMAIAFLTTNHRVQEQR